jgi:hypothetical protein
MTSDAPNPTPSSPGANTAPDAALDDAGNIAEDVTCRRCGYNLRGLPREALCPECATPAALSARSDLLRYTDPRWLEKVLLGLRVAVIAAAVGLTTFFARTFLIRGGLASTLIDALVSVALAWAGWLVTTPDPGRSELERAETARKVTRTALTAGACLHWLFLFATPPVPIALVAAGLADAVGEFAKFNCLRRLALRVPDEPLARRIRIVKWVFPSALVVKSLALVAFALFASRPVVPSRATGFIVAGLAGLFGMFFAYVWWVQVQYMLQRAIDPQLALARRTYALATMPSSAA